MPDTLTLALAMPGSARQPAAAMIRTAAADRNFRCIRPVPYIKCMAPAYPRVAALQGETLPATCNVNLN